MIPQDSLSQAINLMNDPESAESTFIYRIIGSLVAINIAILLGFTGVVYFVTKRTILPIKRATRQIQSLSLGTRAVPIAYDKPDEIGLLIDAINNLNRRLGVQEDIRSRLLADISHELKTPITAIQCYLEGISDGVIRLSDDNLSSIISEMNRLTDLVNRIMEFEKFENTELSVNAISLSPYEILKNIAETQAPMLEKTGQTIDFTGSKNIEIIADEGLFRQM